MIRKIINSLLPHVLILAAFFLLSLFYFIPAYEGKVLNQSDIHQFQGMSKEISDFREKTGKEPLWTNSMFGGMPAYQISTVYKANLLRYFYSYLQIGKAPASYLFLALLGFYILLLAMGLSRWLSAIGALAFGFSTYFFIILVPGHISKFIAMSYMAPVMAGMILAYRKKLLMGAAVFGLFLSLEVYSNHLQITYYLALIIFLYIIFELVSAIREKTLPSFIKTSVVLLVVGILAAGSDFSRLYTTWEYGKYSTRGKSNLTSSADLKTSGLDKDYATSWSYGKAETFDLLIPDFAGGASEGELSTNSETYKWLSGNGVPNARRIIQSMPLYWGPQPSTAGPVYLGAVVIFLFFLGAFLVKGKYKWWLVAVTTLSIMLAWGHNFMPLTSFFLDYVPGYNKFRTVSMTLVMAEFSVPFLGMLALHRLWTDKISREEFLYALKWSLGIVGGICLVFTIIPGLLAQGFYGSIDPQLKDAGYPDQLLQALRNDRESLLRADAFRSLIFVTLSAGLVYFFFTKKLKGYFFLGGMALLVLVDMWSVDKRYLNDNNFVNKQAAKEPFKPTLADQIIMQDTQKYYRVLNLTVNPFSDASTSYFHKSIGGYHGAKMKRYQELIENQISKNNMSVLDMLNTKYFIVPDKQQGPVPQRNPGALGNAWFVDSIKIVPDANAEMAALTSFNPANLAIVDQKYSSLLKDFTTGRDTVSRIILTSYAPNKLDYAYHASKEQLAVFSEIYYKDGWDAFVDGKPAPHFRVNYVLRAMMLPAGSHQVEFRFEPKAFYTGNKVSLACSSILMIFVLLMLGSALYAELKKKPSPEEA